MMCRSMPIAWCLGLLYDDSWLALRAYGFKSLSLSYYLSSNKDLKSTENKERYMTIHISPTEHEQHLRGELTSHAVPMAMGNRFTGLGQSFDWTGHSAVVAQQQAKQLVKAVKVINQ